MASGRFALDIATFAAKYKDRADDAVASVVGRVVASVDMLSPVGDPKLWKHKAPKGYVGGHFRGNWQLGVGTAPSGIVATIDNSAKSSAGGTTAQSNIASIPLAAAGKVYYLTNNLPYGHALEFEGHSSQAPAGMVGLTAVRFQSIVNEAVASAVAARP